ncbi:AAA family ATPase [Clostridium sp. ZS2-4]|uniref:AAA family ATPase n=1 Tax=Clostridium sp. ZS2-4 TaxID=2987703 RepID=UPI00227AEF46|nr:AAA family ATPase [Clostridium sp. ZS2-4]MCY6354185.1 AAA family ATPase [Clostridium sp. ZS2-4]
MEKSFNTAGTCNFNKHYMVDISSKLDIIEKMVDRGDYFVINRPRQYGKTTIISGLSKRLNNKYLIIRTSFEGTANYMFEDEEKLGKELIKKFSKALRFTNIEKSKELENAGASIKSLEDLSDVITNFIIGCDKKVILLIDEVDKASNNELFLSFLGLLRDKFLLAVDGLDYTFHSVILVGVHDIKNLKLKFRKDEEIKLNSPWNIAVNFNLDMSFNPKEIESMLIEYSNFNKLKMSTEELSEKLYYYTNGYPFLVSRLCQIIDENLLGADKIPWIIEDIDRAVKILLRENNTLFDDLIKNLENNKALYSLVSDIVLNGNVISFNISNPVVNIGYIYGIFKDEEYRVKLNNRIYEQFIYDYLISKLEVKSDKMSIYNYKNNFVTADNKLDFQKILIKFQQFMKEQYSSIDSDFIEREGRLLFLAFIKPIVNGVGFDFKEVQISEEKRLDVVVTYNQSKYVIELKIWRGLEYHKKGLNQLDDYLDIQGLDKGYLVVYNFNKNKEYKQENIKLNEKEIFIVYV